MSQPATRRAVAGRILEPAGNGHGAGGQAAHGSGTDQAADLAAPAEQFGDQVGADETGGSGDEHGLERHGRISTVNLLERPWRRRPVAP